MAFSKGKVSIENTGFKRYIGVAPVYVLTVNPDKKELEKLYNTQLENAPEYLGEIEVGEDKHKVPNVRIDFIIKTVAEKCDGVEITTKASLFLRKEYRMKSDGSGIQVIDKYGRTAWANKEEFQKKLIPMYKNGPANIDRDYRAAYVGEEELTNFIKTYLNIPSVTKYVNKTWIMVDNPEDCEARLEHIEDYFKGDFSEIKEAISYQPNNKVKVLFGVKSDNNGRQFQTVYSQSFLRNNVSDYSKLDKEIQDRKERGAFANTDYEVCDFKEYVVTPTTFSSAPSEASDLPFSPDNSPWTMG